MKTFFDLYSRFIILIFPSLLVAVLSTTAFGATFTVTKAADTNDGICDTDCSLREAIAAANAAASNDVINFDAAVFSAARVIYLNGSGLSISNNGSLSIAGTDPKNIIISANNQSGVFAVLSNALTTISGITITNGNTSSGGGIINLGFLTVDNSIIKENFATFEGGGIYHAGGTLTITNSEISRNGGSGIQSRFSMNVTNCVIKNNLNGGISMTNTGLVNIENTTVNGNSESGVYLFNGTVNITNSTISGNTNNSVGGGINTEAGTINLQNSTVAFNSSGSANGGGIYKGSGATVNSYSTIIAKNIGNGSPSDFAGTLNSSGYNLIGTTAFTTVSGNTTGNLTNVDPLLRPLDYYGGNTPTHTLQANSPAIDTGDPNNVSGTDQRGIIRPFDGDGDGNAKADIGSTEAGILVSNTNDGGINSLRQAIATAGAINAKVEIRFSNLFDSAQTIALTSSGLNIGGTGEAIINGPGADKLAISGNNIYRVFKISGGAKATITGLTIRDGNPTEMGNGGGISNIDGGILSIYKSFIINNRANQGAGIYNEGILKVFDSTFSGNNSVNDGGGIVNIGSSSGGLLTVERSTITGNTGFYSGGIANGGTAFIRDSTISGNTATTDCGGIFSGGPTAVLSVMNSAVVNNTTNGKGGGIQNYLGTASLINSTVSGNRSNNSNGGGISNESGIFNLDGATIAFNTAVEGGGVFNFNGGVVNAHNTIIAKNTGTSATPDFAGALVSQRYNLIGNTSGTTISGDTTGNLTNIDPQLLPLSSGGGEIPIHALQTGSPAIDAGDPALVAATDQRGFNRSSDGNGDGTTRPDIGAYELGTLVVNTNDGGPGSLRQAMLDARSFNGIDEIRFAAMFNSPQTITLTDVHLFVGSGKLIINGPGANLLTISGNNQSRVFSVGFSGNLVLNGVAVTGGRITNGDGGGILNFNELTVNNSIISGNSAGGGGSNPLAGGGGIFNSAGTVHLINSQVINNRTTSFNGGGILNARGTLQIFNSSVNGNTGSSNGGGIANYSGTTVIKNSTIDSNSASSSGGIFNEGETIIENSSVSGNTATGSYGGIYNGQTLSLLNATISNNRATTMGGGIFNLGFITMTNSVLSANSANQGGGINNNGGTNNDRGRFTILNSTISGNSATGNGGGIFSVGGIIKLTHGTIAANTANTGGGVYHFNNGNGVFNLGNSIVGDNNAISGNAPDFFGVISSDGYNLIETVNNTTISGTTIGNITGIDPKILPLGNYGGATKTHALRLSSPAVDKGNSFGIPTDQRGQIRPYDFSNISNSPGGDGSDIGAFERQPNDVSGLTFFDFDGDGRSDISVFRPSNGAWYINRSTNGFTGVTFGFGTDLPVPADYDGDGKTDVAVFRDGNWYYLKSSNNSFVGIQWGLSTDIPIPADFDGDGKADINVFRPSDGGWYRLNSSTGAFIGLTFGQNGDKPLIADFDGDGKSDVAVFRPSDGAFYSLDSSTGSFRGVAFGFGSDIPTMGDFDGDGKTDVAVFRPSNGSWYRLNSSTGAFFGVAFGQNGDIPVTADYDGDGKADIAVFRNGDWYYLKSSDGSFVGQLFGFATDKPIPAAFQ